MRSEMSGARLPWQAAIGRRSFLSGMAGGAALISVGRAARAQTTEMLVQYDWLMSNGQIGDVVAQTNGYFAEVGLDVTFMPGGPNSATVPAVTSQQALMGQLSDSGQGLLAASAGAPIKMFAAGFRQSPFAYFSLPDNPIASVQDMVGKRIGTQPTARFVLDALIAKEGLDPEAIEIVTVGWDMNPLANGQVDSITAWVTNTAALSVLGPDRLALMQWDAGLPSYANTYFATDEALATEGEAIANFIRAVAKGWAWMHDHPAESVDILVDAYPELDRAIEHETVAKIVELSFDEATAEHGWGWFDPAVIAEQIATYDSIGLFTEAAPTVDGFVTTEILEATAGDRAKLG
ncbi:MAG: ABC transporter substrate-binding protein [Alphaproteobacteria bacterium]